MTKNAPSPYAFTWLNGSLIPSEKALISVQDRGFRFGDGAFETIPVFGGLPYRVEYHLERLAEGLQALRISFDVPSLAEACRQLIGKNALQNGLLRIAVSRGVGSRGYLPEGNASPTVVIECMDAPVRSEKPARLFLSSYEKPSLKALPGSLKLAQGVNSIMARMEAADNGADEALLLSTAGHLCEASSANIFVAKGDVLYTPGEETGCLLGVTRRIIIEHEKVITGAWPLNFLADADAIALTNAAMGVRAVSALVPKGGQWQSEKLALRLWEILEKDRKTYFSGQAA